jgi:UDP-3-O-[3-hydroxymyristoyl] glucosamine N-acyltransferase
MANESYTLAEIAKHIGAELKGNESDRINKIAVVASASSGDLTFVVDKKYLAELSTCQATAIIISPKFNQYDHTNLLLHPNPHLAYAKAAELFEKKSLTFTGIHATAVIGDDCQIAQDVAIGAFVVIGDRCTIGEGCIINAGTIIGNDCVIAPYCELKSRVTLYHDVTLGEHTMIHSGAVIGSDGFGNAKDGENWYKIPQLGGVRIGKWVEIGANTTVDRGAIDHTVIEDGVRIDNLVQIAHNVRIGAHTALAGCTGVAGSTTIGKHCLVGGQCAIIGHVTIADHCNFTAQSFITRSITEPGVYSSGTGIFKNNDWHKAVVRLRHLDKLFERVKKLEQKSTDGDNKQNEQ